jgi:glycosyltransferase involved in cell wall biosynthesis
VGLLRGRTMRKRRCRPIVLAIGYESNPAMRVRVQQYLEPLQRDGFDVQELLLPQGHGRPPAAKASVLQALWEADVVIVQRILARWLNLLSSATRAPIVFDLDDAVHYIRTSQLQATEHPSGLYQRSRVAYRRRVRGSVYFSSRKRLLDQMLRMARVAIFGNPFLARELGPAATCPTVVIPNSVRTSPDRLKVHEQRWPIKLGWIGTGNNLVHLRELEPALQRLAQQFGDGRLSLHVVTDQPYESQFLATEYTPWSLEREERLVRSFDIGLMPLIDDPFSRGKSAFKAILCMSYGIPVVISPVGVNAELINDGWNGFLASTSHEWETAIARLAEDLELRAKLGQNAYQTIEAGFSTARAYPLLKRIIERVARGEPIDEISSDEMARAVG